MDVSDVNWKAVARFSQVKLPIVQQLSITACPPQPAGSILSVYVYGFYELNRNVSL